MSIDIETARDRLRMNLSRLDDCADDLAYLRDNIPPSPQELAGLDLDGDLDVETEIRAVIAIQLQDRLEPLMRALQAAADYRLDPPEPESVPLDLTQDEETMGRVIRALVVKDWFTERVDEEAPRGVWLPVATPEQAELTVFKAWGGWFATWRKLDMPADAPEAERWERLSITEDPKRPGTLRYEDF
ncbi:MAG TPA: hypothetical protein VGR07_20035 [Thermoanaerobaculia bacterium]|nr:hypothetical protein [Thermoanaerobaculia bacterium]